ncbi:UDP-N-acetylmuramoyl-tripeptide--D-alanyl-D-alanine ligase [Magnetovirga frankeli]|uniref:UDP-N-acetylmuramoyl-tripeptide--D-alanyl-D- alanine ligase n=1 Tax=Magnetovirga frankeli TaxID=947516 RepID=UPI0012936974|nr:UDP-N-acetylmuramoyl-tripeptide--D-alanyl-D-alanine ligase [gamma proteobacterium SS-5]
MLNMRLSQAAAATGGLLVGQDLAFGSVAIDSRRLQGQPLFIALRGERFDGHDYLQQAQAGGAIALMLERPSPIDLPQLLVADCRLALGQLAAAWRKASPAKVVGLTGSNGKTTLKEMLACILGQNGTPVLATQGNLNNDIGVPLTLLRLRDEPLAVIEMGANHGGEIAYLTRLARPDVAILNNAGRSHLEGFGSLEGVARGKGEIIQGLVEDGCFVYHFDSPWAALWRQLAAGKRRLGFGLAKGAEIRSPAQVETRWDAQGFSSRFLVETPADSFEVQMALAGEHNRLNALAAIAACYCLGIPDAQVQQGLARIAPVPGRLHCRPLGSGFLLDDSYNANPESLSAAIQVLRSAPGERILVLGDMAELGADSASLHAEIGTKARAAGIDRLYAVGPLAQQAVEAFGPGAAHFSDQQALIQALGQALRGSETLLVKGSRSSAMDRVVAALLPEKNSCC